MRSPDRCIVLGLLALFHPSAPLQGQGSLLEARVEVHLPADEAPIPVEIVYRLRRDSAGVPVPLSMLVPESVEVTTLRAALDRESPGPPQVPWSVPGSEVAGFRMNPTRIHYWEGSVPLPWSPSDVGDVFALRFSYRVSVGTGNDGRIELPLVVPLWVPDRATPETFLATVEVPAGARVVGSFPSSVVARSPRREEGVLEIGLQGVPSMLVLRLSRGDEAFLTLEGWLDLAVILVLLAMTVAGVGYLRRGGA